MDNLVPRYAETCPPKTRAGAPRTDAAPKGATGSLLCCFFPATRPSVAPSSIVRVETDYFQSERRPGGGHSPRALGEDEGEDDDAAAVGTSWVGKKVVSPGVLAGLTEVRSGGSLFRRGKGERGTLTSCPASYWSTFIFIPRGDDRHGVRQL